MSKQFYAHKFYDITMCDFDPADYSRLKFGSNVVADKFGKDMAHKFYQENHEFISECHNKNKEIVVVPSAFNMLEIAATILAKAFVRHLNEILSIGESPIVKYTTMHRTITYFSDYAHMTHDERKSMLAGDSFFINKDYVKGKVLLFLDDVIITGTHEDKIKEFIKKEQLDNEHMFLYYVKYDGNNPETEAQLNTAGVNDVRSFVALTKEPNHQIIVRTCKFLLNGSKKQMMEILGQCSDEFIHRLYQSCVLEEYHTVPRYRENMRFIRELVELL